LFFFSFNFFLLLLLLNDALYTVALYHTFGWSCPAAAQAKGKQNRQLISSFLVEDNV
jgi:D-alanyl-lipoteichoic acid acyltransferase DltB (MBOAT superfamily)